MTATTPAPTWTADLITETVYVQTEDRHGDPKTVVVKKRRIELTRGDQLIVFRVGRGKDGKPVISDHRERATGAAALTLRGPLPGPDYCKAGSVRKLTPTGWAAEVERLIGPEGIAQIYVALVRSGLSA